MKIEYMLFMLAGLLVFGIFLSNCFDEETQLESGFESGLKKFTSEAELIDALEEAKDRGRGGFGKALMEVATGGLMKSSFTGTMAEDAQMAVPAADYSETNVQVKGVDEADIIKTDGRYVYAIVENKLIIAEAYPVKDAEILLELELGSFRPQELFIHNNRLLMFGNNQGDYIYKKMSQPEEIVPRFDPGMEVRLYDTADKGEIELLRTVDFEGRYLTSRKIGGQVYFVVNSYPQWNEDEVIPLYREDGETEKIAEPTEIGYIEPMQAQNFITVASISMTEIMREVEKETIAGSGQNVYASLDNIYVAQTNWPAFDWRGELEDNFMEQTVVIKFSLDEGTIRFEASGEVPGHILNQFSMDEHEGYFRIATTKGEVWSGKSANNVYVLNSDMKIVGELEDLAPGEKIYSVRFMGERGYVVTFKKVDPLFVIDLSEPSNPAVLGKLKIPGYSDYLHPYDEDHIIGIGKDTVEAAEELKTGRQLDFAWYQGVKMALFDVSDVENPVELHKVVIGDRGTDSEALRDHKAFLFDRERNLLVLPITLAEIKGEKTADNQYGEFTFQGVYVYDLSVKGGFDLQGTVTHYDSDEAFKKSGYYFRGDSAIRRSLYIREVLYTFSDNRLQLNDLDNLETLKKLEFGNFG